jgi:hypothetical protein
MYPSRSPHILDASHIDKILKMLDPGSQLRYADRKYLSDREHALTAFELLGVEQAQVERAAFRRLLLISTGR